MRKPKSLTTRLRDSYFASPMRAVYLWGNEFQQTKYSEYTTRTNNFCRE